MEITVEMALHFAEPWGFTWEVQSYIEMGYTPREALREWDIVPTKAEVLEYIYGDLNTIIF